MSESKHPEWICIGISLQSSLSIRHHFAVGFHRLLDAPEVVHADQVHGEALHALVHSRAEDALHGRRIVDLPHVVIGDLDVFEDDVAEFAVGAVIAEADYGIVLAAATGCDDVVGGSRFPEVWVCKFRRKGELITWSSPPTCVCVNVCGNV